MSTPLQRSTRQWATPLVVLAVVVYTPLLLTAPGRVVADTKTYLYLDPGRLLSRAVSMWDPHTSLGTVPHQQIGYLWPSGPFYWLMEQVGSPDWVAQRLWLGTIMVAAGAGVLYLGRTWRWRPEAAAGAAFVYALSPFVLTLAARISVLLLPFAGLPWLLAFTVRALHTRGWRYPVLFGLTLATIGSVNATSVLLIGIVPVVWIVYAVVGARTVGRARAVNTILKQGAVALTVNLWWIVGLSVQATNGIDILRYTETAQVVADASAAPEVLRGLGYWFFYGGDRLGPWIEPSVDYTQRLGLIALTYAIPALGLLALGVVRWRHRAFLVVILLTGTIISVGAHTWDDPSPIGAAIKAFLLTDVGLAMRSLPRAVPLVALALALGIGSLVGALSEQAPRRGLIASVAVAALAYAALPPLWGRGLAPDNLQRPEEIPEYWLEAARHLDERDDGTRILEVPGIDFASYRWGNTVDPITPGLVDRPYVARELIPNGSNASADLLKAFDLQLQERTMPAEGLDVMARILAAGDVVLRNDLQYERFNTPRPRSLWDLALDTDGLGDPAVFGVDVPNVAIPEAPLLDETHLAFDAALPESPAVAVFPVEAPVQILRTAPAEQVVLLSGDGAGIVDAATAGLLVGDELIRYSATVTDDPDFVRTELVDERALIVTDTNRRQAERWTTVRHTEGFTEQVDGGILDDDVTDNRLPVLENRPGTQTVAEHRGVSVRATDYGNPITYTPEERPANGADGDPTTAWRVAAFADAVGHRIVLEFPEPVTAQELLLLQPQTGEINRWITEVAIRFDGVEELVVPLDDSSRTTPGQVVTFPSRTFQEVSIEILADTAGRRPGYDSLTSVGFAEIGVGGIRVDEVIRMPSDLLDAGGYRTLRYPLALVQTRQRSAATEVTRTDEEFSMTRAVDLPVTRMYSLHGRAHLSARADTSTLDAVLGRFGTLSGAPEVRATSTLPGGVAHLPSNVLDGDPTTVWTSAFQAATDAALTITAPTVTTFDEISFEVLDDDAHSVPAAVRVIVDGEVVADTALRPTPAGPDRSRAVVELAAPVSGTVVELSFPAVTERTTINWYGGNPIVQPLAIAELELADLAVGPRPLLIDTGCRDDLVRIDDEPVPIRVTGPTDDALAGRGLEVSDCDPGTEIPAGDRVFRTAEGRDTGIDLDQLVWRSAAGGDIAPLELPILTTGAPVPRVRAIDQRDAQSDLRITGATPGEPFWLILGQSHNPGWSFEAELAEAEGPFLVNGYANAWLVTPTDAAFDASVRFVPQNRVEVGLLVSLVGVLAALGLLAVPGREVRPLPIPLIEPLRRLRALSYEGALPTVREARLVGLAAGLAGLVLANPVVGLAVGLVAGFATRRETWRPMLTVVPAILLAIVAAYVISVQFRNEIGPGLHWPNDTGRMHPLGLAAVILLAVDVAIDRLWVSRSDYR